MQPTEEQVRGFLESAFYLLGWGFFLPALVVLILVWIFSKSNEENKSIIIGNSFSPEERLGVEALFRRINYLVDDAKGLDEEEKIEVLNGAKALKKLVSRTPTNLEE